VAGPESFRGAVVSGDTPKPPDGDPHVSHELSSRHRNTLEKLLDHQGHANVEWREVISLLEQVADVHEEHNGKFKVKLGDDVLFLHRPKHKDVDQQVLVDVRKLLEQGGVGLT